MSKPNHPAAAPRTKRSRGRPPRWQPRDLVALWYEMQFERILNRRTLDAAILAVRHFRRYQEDKLQSLRARYKEACALVNDEHWGKVMRRMQSRLKALPDVEAPTPREHEELLDQIRARGKRPKF